MSPSAASAALNALNNVNLRSATVAPVTTESKEGFQALLDVGVDAESADKDPRPVREDRKEILAAPVDAPVALEKPQVDIQLDDTDHDAHVRAYRGENKGRERIANDDSDSSGQPVDKKQSYDSVADLRAADQQSKANSDAAADGAAQDDSASDLRNRIDALSDVLGLFAAIGGNPQDVQVKIESLTLQLTTVTVAQQSLSLTEAKFTGTDGTFDMNAAFKDILAQIAGLQELLSGLDGDNVKKSAPSFRALIHDIRDMARYIDGNPNAAKQWANDKDSLIQATRGLIGQYRMMEGTALDQPVDGAGDASNKQVNNAMKLAAKQPLANTFFSLPDVTMNPSATAPVTVTFAAAATAAANSNFDAQTNTGGNQNDGQSLLQSLNGVKETRSAGASQAANAPSFSKLLEQAQAPVLDQIMLHIKSMGDNKSEIKISLHPEELGKLEIKLNVDINGKTVTSVTADNKNTLDLLQRDSRGLQQALSDAGLKTDSGSLSFNLRGGEQQNQNPEFAKTYKSPVSEEAELAPVATLTRSYVVNLKEGLDLTV